MLWYHAGEAGMRSLVSSVAIQLWDALDRVTLLMDLGEYSEDPFDLQSKYGWEIGSGAVTRSRQEAADYRRAMRALEEQKATLKESLSQIADDFRHLNGRLDALLFSF